MKARKLSLCYIVRMDAYNSAIYVQIFAHGERAREVAYASLVVPILKHKMIQICYDAINLISVRKQRFTIITSYLSRDSSKHNTCTKNRVNLSCLK